VAEYKKTHGLPIYDEKREEEVIRNGTERVEDETLRGDYGDFMREIMVISRRYQQKRMDSAEGRITVELGKNSYTVTVLRGALACAGQYMNLSRKVLVVTDSGVPASYAKTVAAQCAEAVVVTVPQGESSKNFDNYRRLCSAMLEKGFTRTDCVVAVGGGVVGDLAGFAAATFMRGIDFYNIPTTVLSQVDSSVGGKTAIDLDGIKNCVGAFHQPKAVLIDPDVLATLPQRQMANGLAEVVKMAVNFDEDLLSLLEEGDFLSRMEEIIAASVKIKAAVVMADEKEAGLRRVLNFGHTIGHGIETAAAGQLYHGECVALGMLSMCSDDLRPRVKALLEKLGLPTACQVDPDAVWAAICHDKKLSGNQITVVYAPEAGSFQLRSMPVEDLKETVYTFLERGKEQ
jgi:3-dehydroquinate synthase